MKLKLNSQLQTLLESDDPKGVGERAKKLKLDGMTELTAICAAVTQGKYRQIFKISSRDKMSICKLGVNAVEMVFAAEFTGWSSCLI